MTAFLSAIQHLEEFLNNDTERYSTDPTIILGDLFEKLQKNEETFSSLHSNSVRSGLVRGRFMIQNSEEPEYVNFTCKVKNGDNVSVTTMFLRDHFDSELEVEVSENDKIVTRQCYSLVEVPGATKWFIDEFESEDSTPEHKKKRGENATNSLKLKLAAKFYGESLEHLKPNTIVDIHGVLNEIQSENSTISSIHVIKYNIIAEDTVSKDFNLPVDDMKCVRDVLKKNLAALLGDDVSASFCLANLISSTYARPGGMPICCIPVNIAGVSNSEPIITFLQSVLPKVKVLQLTPELLSNSPFAPVKNYNDDVLLQGELQLTNGTLVIIDETKLPESSFPVSGYVQANLKTLEQLILEQRIQYDYGFYKLPFDVDLPIIIISQKASRILKTPFIVPYLPNVGQQNIPTLEEGLSMVRKYIQSVRKNLRHVGITAETTTAINEGFVDLVKNIGKDIDKADLLNELLILCRLLAASEGSSVVTEDHWKNAITMEASRKDIMKEFERMNSSNK